MMSMYKIGDGSRDFLTNEGKVNGNKVGGVNQIDKGNRLYIVSVSKEGVKGIAN